MRPSIIILSALLATGPVLAQEKPLQSSVDYPAFQKLTSQLMDYRQDRLVPLEQFNRLADAEVIILDTRSAAAFERGHIKGAVNLPFSDFTDEKLQKILGKDQSRAILIYCNNNFSDNVAPVPLKLPALALNIPTFINLYGYGYKNIYELSGSYQIDNPDVKWVSAKPV